MKYIKINELYEELYSKYYYLVVKIPSYRHTEIFGIDTKNTEKVFNGLLNGKFVGLTGISDNVNILDSFFDIRDMLLVMPKESVKKINTNLLKIDYFDVEKLCDNNMLLIKRLYGHYDTERNISFLFSQVLNKKDLFRYPNSKTFDILKKNLDVYKLNLFYKIRKKASNTNLMFLIDNSAYLILSENESINNFSDLVDAFYNYYKTVDNDVLANKLPYRRDKNLKLNMITREMVEDAMRYIILSFSCCFLSEGEILVNNKYFNIPADTVIFLKNREGSIIKNIVSEYKLDEIYKIKYVKDVEIKFKSLSPYFAKTLIRKL
jgi:hypothetical protein